MKISEEFWLLPKACKEGTCTHPEGVTCIHYRSRGCLSGECTHGSQNLNCGEFLPPEPAPEPEPTQQLAVRVERRDDGSLLTFRTLTKVPADASIRALADLAAQLTRTGHNCWDALVVYVWPITDETHYRKPVPEDAQRFEYGAVA